MPDLSSFVPADTIPGMLDGWVGPIHTMTGIPMIWDGDKPFGSFEQLNKLRLDTRRPEVRDHLSRVLARVLGVAVGATAPTWFNHDGQAVWGLGSGEQAIHNAVVFQPVKTRPESHYIHTTFTVPSLSSIPLDSPDRDSLALATVVRWVGEEIRAGRVKAPQ